MSYDEALPQLRKQLRTARIHQLEAKVRVEHWQKIGMVFPDAITEDTGP